uniref:L-Fucosyltransferase n=1 Tax=Panagrolaimus superbus TaxID=310955 RepID=A0A914ZDX3_9BILA
MAGNVNINRSFITLLSYGILIFIIIYLLFFQPRTITMQADEFYAVMKPQCPVFKCSENGSQQIQQFLNCSNENENLLEKAYERKYIGCNFWAVGGIGNQIWRFASLYGLGRFTGRHPYFEARNPPQMERLMEIAEVFPMMHEILQVKNPPDSIIKKYHFADDCCKFDNPKKLLGLPEKYVKIAGDYMQSYKFFHPYRDEIRKVYDCGPTVKASAALFSNDLYKNDTSLKLCAHIRRGDFIKDIMLESKEDFTIPALRYAFNYLKEKEKKNISMTFIGNDRDFVTNLSLADVGFFQIYTPEAKSRGEDMCFGINHCDAMVLTASGSTFGWWIAYLMKPNSPIFYNSQITDNADFTKDVHDFDIFPEEWIMLTSKDGKAEHETKWWHQRKNKPPDLPSDKMDPWT